MGTREEERVHAWKGGGHRLLGRNII
jgi:hypothetical protein